MQFQTPSGPTTPPLLVDEREAGRLLGVTSRTVFSLRKAGELPAVKIGSRVLYERTALAEFIQRRRELVTA
jgi:excisionase family DNA binding protein